MTKRITNTLKVSLLLLLTFSFQLSTVFSQTPNAFSYQAVARASNGDLITEQAVSFKISILQGSTSGTSVYSEIHSATTNKYGLVNLQIGNGTSGNDFTAINWANGPYFVKVEMDATGGTTYAEMGTSQLLSVPFAKYAELSGNAALPQYTQDEIDALSPVAGMLVYNTDYKMLQFYDGTQWSGSQSSGCVPQPNSPSAGNEVNSTNFTINISGTQPNKGIKGYWFVASNNGGSFADSSNYETSFNGVNDSLYQLTWSLYSECDTNTSSNKRVYMSNTVKSIDFSGTMYIYPVDNSTGIQWYNGSYITTNATSTTDGAANTDSIVKYQGAGAYATYLCDTLTAFGHSDWYLPAKDELNAMYQNKATIGGFSSSYYWSSTEYDNNDAWYQFFYNGNQHYHFGKLSKFRVRCVRRD
jgi:hypothetical protein